MTFAVDRASLGRATLARQMLLERTTIKPFAAIERLFAIQAQLARPPFVGLWTRVADYRRDQLHALLRDNRVVRATSLRGTLHVMSARDYVELRMAMQPMLSAGMASVLRDRAKGLDPPKVIAAASAFLRKQPATFDAIRDALVAEFPDVNDRALGYAVRMLLPLVQVPTDDRWAFPGAAAFAVAEHHLGTKLGKGTLHAIVRRYLAGFGPASVADAQVWSGIAGLKPVFDELRPELVVAKDGKRELFDLPDAPRPAADTPAPVRFIPEFDNLVLGHADRSRLIDDDHRGRVTTKNLQVRATLLVEGRVAGTWTVERNKATATVVIEPFGKIAKKHRAAIDHEGEALAQFVEPDATSVAVR
jgi:hypothetical protein